MSPQVDMVKSEGGPSLLPSFGREKVDLIKRTVAKGATDDELKLFLYQAQKKGLDPLSKQIYFQKRRNKNGGDDITIITGIDGYRAIAARTGECAGNDDPVFDDEQSPGKATVTVYRMVRGVRCAFTATARWDQYYPGDALGFMWRKMPHLMLGKCAEALALRKAFPDELSGVYVKEEMDQAGPEVLVAPVVEAPSLPPDEPEVYSGSPEHEGRLAAILRRLKIDEVLWERVGEKLVGKPMVIQYVNAAVAETLAEVER